MAQLIEDATVSLKLNGVITELHPELSKQQVQEVAHHVYHKMNMIPLYNQARKLITEYVNDKDFNSIGGSFTTQEDKEV